MYSATRSAWTWSSTLVNQQESLNYGQLSWLLYLGVYDHSLRSHDPLMDSEVNRIIKLMFSINWVLVIFFNSWLYSEYSVLIWSNKFCEKRTKVVKLYDIRFFHKLPDLLIKVSSSDGLVVGVI